VCLCQFSSSLWGSRRGNVRRAIPCGPEPPRRCTRTYVQHVAQFQGLLPDPGCRRMPLSCRPYCWQSAGGRPASLSLSDLHVLFGAEHAAVDFSMSLRISSITGPRRSLPPPSMKTLHLGHAVCSGLIRQVGPGGAPPGCTGPCAPPSLAKHHQVQQAVGAQAVGPVHRGAGRLARGIEAGHHLLGAFRPGITTSA
jgi:hypothetical protein